MSVLSVPRAWRAGDRVAAVSLSWGGPGVFPQQYELGKRQLEAEDLMRAFADPTAVLFMETSEAAPPPDRLLRFIRSLDALGVLRRLQAILLGRPGGCRPQAFAAYDAALLQGVRDEAGLDIPLITQLDFGHTDPMWVLPLGAAIDIDCGAETLRLNEPASRPSD